MAAAVSLTLARMEVEPVPLLAEEGDLLRGAAGFLIEGVLVAVAGAALVGVPAAGVEGFFFFFSSRDARMAAPAAIAAAATAATMGTAEPPLLLGPGVGTGAALGLGAAAGGAGARTGAAASGSVAANAAAAASTPTGPVGTSMPAARALSC